MTKEEKYTHYRQQALQSLSMLQILYANDRRDYANRTDLPEHQKIRADKYFADKLEYITRADV